MRAPAERPLGVTLIAILLALNGISSIISAIGLLGPRPEGAAGVVLGLLFGVALFFLAYGMWTLQFWAWVATLAIEGLNAIFALVTLFLAPGAITVWVSLILAIIIIVYLVQPGVRDAFGRRRAGL